MMINYPADMRRRTVTQRQLSALVGPGIRIPNVTTRVSTIHDIAELTKIGNASGYLHSDAQTLYNSFQHYDVG